MRLMFFAVFCSVLEILTYVDCQVPFAQFTRTVERCPFIDVISPDWNTFEWISDGVISIFLRRGYRYSRSLFLATHQIVS